MIEYANMDYIKIYFMHIQECSVLNCLYLGNIWGICDLSTFSDIFSLLSLSILELFGKCDAILTG